MNGWITRKRSLLCLVAMLLAFTGACSDDPAPVVDRDIAADTSNETDTSGADAGTEPDGTTLPDTSNPDVSGTDVSDTDASDPGDAGQDTADDADLDASSPEDADAGQSDTNEPDASEPDTDEPDTDEPDTSEPDVGEPDVGEPDVGDIDPCATDNGSCGDPLVYLCVHNPGGAPTCEQILATGTLYPGFGTNGLADFGTLSPSLRPYSIATIAGDSIFVAGDSRTAADAEPSCAVQHFDQAGALVGSFGTDGGVAFLPADTNSCSLRALSRGPSGTEALLAGFASSVNQEVALVGRVSPAGIEHSTLARAGAPTFSMHSVLPMADGRFIGTGRSNPMGARFIATLTRHTLDLSAEIAFGTDRYRDLAWPQVQSAIMVRDIAALGSDYALVVGTIERDNGDASGIVFAFDMFTGDLKSGFGNGGIVEFIAPGEPARFQSVSVSGDRIYAVGSRGFGADEDTMVVAFTHAGALDSTYGTNGVVLSEIAGRDRPYDSILDAEGRLLIAGEYKAGTLTQPSALRVLTTGEFDTTFEWFGIAALPYEANESEAWSIALGSQGQVFVAGRARIETTGLDKPFLVQLVP